jgi:hypothetical protein
MVSKLDPDDDEQDQFVGDVVDEAAYITKEETVLLSINDVAFDNGSTIHLIKNPKLLTHISTTKNPIVVNGVQSDAAGVRVNMKGRLGDIGTVYYSKNATANILSIPNLVDSGDIVKYDSKGNKFTVQPKGNSQIYNFSRRNVAGNDSKFCVCNMDTLFSSAATNYPPGEEILVASVAQNMVGSRWSVKVT